MNKTILQEYAKLIARCGVNVQKGQEVLINCGLDQPEFVAMVVEEAYKAGAGKVTVNWNYQPLTRLHAEYQEIESLGAVQEWEKVKLQHYVDTVPCRIHLISDDPDGLKGVRMDKISKARQLSYPILKPYSDARNGKEQWCGAAVPGVAWAKKLFPELEDAEAVEKLWEAILSASRVLEGDPIENWAKHNANMESHCHHLNSLNIEKVHIFADNGTDITVGLIPEGQFCGGGETTKSGIFFNPNIPTEECFTTPMRGQAEGIVYATKPLSYQGQMIDKFWMRFEGGKVVESHAEIGDEVLTTMLDMDEGARYLGEVAIVPQSSPINLSGLLFFNTLYDENAVCHLAVGMGYMDCLTDYHNRSNEECRALGVNDSMIHTDFMIGCDTMNIDAICANGETVRVFANGEWTF
ncbi:MAG: aminopeptidase [Oscillospiraceae bacterium]|nr:aminopeptidase [Oscillospiraceae bacterium]